MKGFIKILLMGRKSSWVDRAKVIYDLIPPHWRYGKEYREFSNLLVKSEFWSKTQLESYQTERLSRLIEHCYSKVPYYKKLFRKIGIIPSDIGSAKDLSQIPYLTKEIISRKKNDFIADDFSILNQDPDETSGSTGNPLMFYVDKSTRAMEILLASRHLSWLDFKKRDAIAEIKEDQFADPNKIYEFYSGSNQLRFSVFRANSQKIRQIVEILKGFRAKYIRAFPSTLELISRWMLMHKFEMEPPRFITTSSENLYESTRKMAETAFGAPVIDYYGQNEKVATAFQCKEKLGYHIQMEQAIVELVPSQEDASEIVGTSLTAFGMPFIRYKTGDYARIKEDACPCGRHHPTLADIVGRQSEFLFSPDREIIAPVTLDYALYGFEDIKEAQFEQVSINEILLRIVPWQTFSDKTLNRLMKKVKDHINSPKIKINFEIVDEVKRTPRGKRPFVINHLVLDEFLE